MTDNLSNNIPTPFTPSGNPSVLPDSSPPQEVAVDPIPPLPSMSASAANPPSKFGDPEPKVETVIEPDPPKPVEKPVTPLVPSVPEENPAIRPPGAQSAVGDKSGDPYVKKHPSLPKVTIAGIASLVFLVVALGSGLYLTRQKQEVQILAGGKCDGWADPGSTHCNTEQCKEYYCNNGTWQATGNSCGGGNCGGGQVRCGDGVCNAGENCSNCEQDCSGGGGCGGGGGGGNLCEGVSCPGGQHCEGGQCQPNTGSGSGGQELISFVCDRCNEFQQCNFGPVRDGGGSGSASPCGQVDLCPVSNTGAIDYSHCEARKLCDASCSGGPTSPPQPTSPPPVPTEPPAATPTPVTISANCQSLVGQMSNGSGGWTTKTDAEFAASARPGDGVRFVCTGHKTQGAFTKAAFFINNILHVDDVVKLNENQFAVEYTIPAAGSLEVEAVLLHDSKGWVD